MNESKYIRLGNTDISLEWLQSVTEKEALANCPEHIHKGRMINAWKQANGKKKKR
jgi:hypothetical protein